MRSEQSTSEFAPCLKIEIPDVSAPVLSSPSPKKLAFENKTLDMLFAKDEKLNKIRSGLEEQLILKNERKLKKSQTELDQRVAQLNKTYHEALNHIFEHKTRIRFLMRPSLAPEALALGNEASVLLQRNVDALTNAKTDTESAWKRINESYCKSIQRNPSFGYSALRLDMLSDADAIMEVRCNEQIQQGACEKAFDMLETNAASMVHVEADAYEKLVVNKEFTDLQLESGKEETAQHLKRNNDRFVDVMIRNSDAIAQACCSVLREPGRE